jgi:hypothetical protein
MTMLVESVALFAITLYPAQKGWRSRKKSDFLVERKDLGRDFSLFFRVCVANIFFKRTESQEVVITASELNA